MSHINTSFSVTHTEFTLSDLVHPLQGDPTGSQPSYKNSNMFTPTYNTPVAMSPTWSSILRTQADAPSTQHTISGLGSNARGYLIGRRPSYGMSYPRGYYNK